MSDNSPDLTGSTLGSWTLLRLLGEGGFGAVYEAQHTTIAGRRAAVKVLHPHLAFQKEIKRRFISEASIASQADHENIVQVFDGGVSGDGTCYVAMELLKGQSLAQCIQSEKRLEVARTLRIAIQVAGALEAAHSMGVVHRDLKPDNIFITPRKTNPNFAKVLDFGIAKLHTQDSKTATGTLLGTPLYMSPEQWQTLPDIDGRADLYSLGVILYECLTGQLPYDGETPFALMMAHLKKDVPDPARIAPVPKELSRLVRRLLAKQREQRPASAREVINELRRLAGEPEQATAPSVDPFSATAMTPQSPFVGHKSLSLRLQTGELIRTAISRHRLLISVGGAAILCGFIVMLWVLSRVPSDSASGSGTLRGTKVAASAAHADAPTPPPDMLAPQPVTATVTAPEAANKNGRSSTSTVRSKTASKGTKMSASPKKATSGSASHGPSAAEKKGDSDLYSVPVIR